jgi:hypothetical protein
LIFDLLNFCESSSTLSSQEISFALSLLTRKKRLCSFFEESSFLSFEGISLNSSSFLPSSRAFQPARPVQAAPALMGWSAYAVGTEMRELHTIPRLRAFVEALLRTAPPFRTVPAGQRVFYLRG